MTYILLYLALGLPVVVITALAGQESTAKRIAQALFFLPVWPVFPVAVAREWMTLKRIRETCYWCGEVVTPYRAPDRTERWRAHHHQCQKHPLNEVITRLKQRNAALEQVLMAFVNEYENWPEGERWNVDEARALLGLTGEKEGES